MSLVVYFFGTQCIYACTQKVTGRLSLVCRTEPKKANSLELKTTNTEMLRTNSPVIKSVKSVLKPEESLWWERSVKAEGLSRVRELWMVRVLSRHSEKMW